MDAPQESYRPNAEWPRVSIGADPEFFVGEVRRSGNRSTLIPVPVCGLLGGTKKEPKPLGEERGLAGYACQEDNVMAEYNIPPSFSHDDFQVRIVRGHDMVIEEIRKKLPTATRMMQSGVKFTDKQLDNEQAQTFGCEPDFDAYAGGSPAAAVYPAALAKKGGAMRYAGGHVHIGWSTIPDVPRHIMANLFDAFAYLPLLVADRQEGRRQLYGTAGRFRPKPYGVEYRTPSNFWLADPHYTLEIGRKFLRVARAIGLLEVDYIRSTYQQVPWADVKHAINKEDIKLATKITSFLNNEVAFGVRM